jgi:hypothetical protein
MSPFRLVLFGIVYPFGTHIDSHRFAPCFSLPNEARLRSAASTLARSSSPGGSCGRDPRRFSWKPRPTLVLGSWRALLTRLDRGERQGYNRCGRERTLSELLIPLSPELERRFPIPIHNI